MPNNGIKQSTGGIGIFHSIEKNIKSYTDVNNQPGLGEHLHFHELDKSLMLIPDSIAGNFTDMNTGWKDIIGSTRDVFPMNASWCGSCKTAVTEWGGAGRIAMKIESTDIYSENRVFEFTQFNAPIDIGNHQNTVSKYNPTTGVLVNTYPVGDTPRAVAYYNGYIWTANYMSHTVTKVDPATGNTIGSYNAGWNPVALAFNSTHIFIASESGNCITQLTLAGVFVRTFSVGHRPTSVAVDASNIWVTCESDNNVYKVNIASGTVTVIPVGKKPSAVIYDGSGYFWVANAGNNNVMRFSASGGSPAIVTVGRSPSSLLSAGGFIWVSNKDDNTVSNISGLSVIGTYTVGFSPEAMVQQGTSIWIANYGANKLVKINYSGTVLSEIVAEYCPSSIAFDGTYLWTNNAPKRKSTWMQIDFGIQVNSRGVSVEGSGYRIEWKSDQYPIFWSPEEPTAADPTKKERKALGRYNITVDEILAYKNGGAVKWVFMPTEKGEMVILCTAFSGRWVINGLKNKTNSVTPLGLPAGKISILVDGLASSVNMHAVTYPEFGICKTDWINLNDFDIMTKEIEKFLTMAYPYSPGSNTSKWGMVRIGLGEQEFVAPVDAIDGKSVKHRIKIYLMLYSGNFDPNKGYGTTTPVVRGWQVASPPEYTYPTEHVPQTDITSFIKDCNVNLNVDASTDSISMSLENNRYWTVQGIEGASFLQGLFLQGLPINNLSCELEYGYTKSGEDPFLENDTRVFKGFIPSGSWSANMGKDTYNISVKSPALQCLQSELYNSPCLMGFAIDEAIATIATWTGIPSSKIYIHAKESDNAAWKKKGTLRDVLLYPVSDDATCDSVTVPDSPVRAYLVADNDDDTYVKQSALGYFNDLYACGANNIPATAHINSVTVRGRAKGNTNVQVSVASGSALPDIVDTGYVGLDWGYISHTWKYNPSTGKGWTKAEIDNLFIGVGGDSDGTYDLACSSLYVNINYREAILDKWGNPVVDTPDFDWTYLDDDVKINSYLSGDEFNMETPAWLNNQQKGWETMAKIADKFGYSLYFEGDCLHIERMRHRYPVPVNGGMPDLEFVYGKEPESDTFCKLREVSLTPAEKEVCNIVVGEATDGNGNPIMCCDIDYDSINDPNNVNFVGYRLSHRFIDSEIKSQNHLNAATRIYMSTHRAGTLTMSANTIFKEGWWIRPGMVFSLNADNFMARDIYDRGKLFRVKTVTLSTGLDTVWTISFTAEDIDRVTPYAYTTIGSKPVFSAIRYLINGMRPLSASLQTPDNSGNAVFLRCPKHTSKYRFAIGDVFGGGIGGGDDICG